MHKAGTVAEIETLKEKLPDEVYREAHRIVTMLDELFGAERDIDFDDGGIVLIAEDRNDLDEFAKQYVELDSAYLEYAELVPSEKEPYLNAFYLYNEYEFGITLLIPVSIAPQALLNKAKNTKQLNQPVTIGEKDA